MSSNLYREELDTIFAISFNVFKSNDPLLKEYAEKQKAVCLFGPPGCVHISVKGKTYSIMENSNCSSHRLKQHVLVMENTVLAILF